MELFYECIKQLMIFRVVDFHKGAANATSQKFAQNFVRNEPLANKVLKDVSNSFAY
jgi:hypothetical protein